MKIFSHTLIYTIKIYKLFVSPYIGNNCRYLPTCSEYFISALKKYGFFKGTGLGTKRLLSCHPVKFLGGGEGFDPVDDIKVKK